MRNRHCRYGELNESAVARRLVVMSPPQSSWLFWKRKADKECLSLSRRSLSPPWERVAPLSPSFSQCDQDLPLRDRRQGWKHEGQGAPRGRGSSCCVSNFQLILSGRSTCSTLSGASSPWWHDPDKFSDRLPTPDVRDVISTIKWDD